MSESDDEPLFPEDWGWQRYEAGIRQLARNIAAAAETPDPYRRIAFETPRAELTDYESVKLNDWADRAQVAGDVPSRETVLKLENTRRREFDCILQNMVAVERLRIRAEQTTTADFEARPKASEFGNAPEGKLAPRNADPGLPDTFPVHGNGPGRGNDGGRSR